MGVERQMGNSILLENASIPLSLKLRANAVKYEHLSEGALDGIKEQLDPHIDEKIEEYIETHDITPGGGTAESNVVIWEFRLIYPLSDDGYSWDTSGYTWEDLLRVEEKGQLLFVKGTAVIEGIGVSYSNFLFIYNKRTDLERYLIDLLGIATGLDSLSMCPRFSLHSNEEGGIDIIEESKPDTIHLSGLVLSDVPTSDPEIEGTVWNDNGILKISNGPITA